MQKINLVIPDNMDYRTSEAYRTLRTNVLFCGEEINAIAVTSCTPGEGNQKYHSGWQKALPRQTEKFFISMRIFAARYSQNDIRSRRK